MCVGPQKSANVSLGLTRNAKVRTVVQGVSERQISEEAQIQKICQFVGEIGTVQPL
jgi:hypothetical protein